MVVMIKDCCASRRNLARLACAARAARADEPMRIVLLYEWGVCRVVLACRAMPLSHWHATILGDDNKL